MNELTITKKKPKQKTFAAKAIHCLPVTVKLLVLHVAFAEKTCIVIHISNHTSSLRLFSMCPSSASISSCIGFEEVFMIRPGVRRV